MGERLGCSLEAPRAKGDSGFHIRDVEAWRFQLEQGRVSAATMDQVRRAASSGMCEGSTMLLLLLIGSQLQRSGANAVLQLLVV